MVTYAAEETRHPEQTIPRALMLGVALVVAVYLALNAAYLYLLPLEKVTSSTRVAADAALAMAGPRGAAGISALVILPAIGVLNGANEELLTFHAVVNARSQRRARRPSTPLLRNQRGSDRG